MANLSKAQRDVIRHTRRMVQLYLSAKITPEQLDEWWHAADGISESMFTQRVMTLIFSETFNAQSRKEADNSPPGYRLRAAILNGYNRRGRLRANDLAEYDREIAYRRSKFHPESYGTLLPARHFSYAARARRILRLKKVPRLSPPFPYALMNSHRGFRGCRKTVNDLGLAEAASFPKFVAKYFPAAGAPHLTQACHEAMMLAVSKAYKNK